MESTFHVGSSSIFNSITTKSSDCTWQSSGKWLLFMGQIQCDTSLVLMMARLLELALLVVTEDWSTVKCMSVTRVTDVQCGRYNYCQVQSSELVCSWPGSFEWFHEKAQQQLVPSLCSLVYEAVYTKSSHSHLFCFLVSTSVRVCPASLPEQADKCSSVMARKHPQHPLPAPTAPLLRSCHQEHKEENGRQTCGSSWVQPALRNPGTRLSHGPCLKSVSIREYLADIWSSSSFCCGPGWGGACLLCCVWWPWRCGCCHLCCHPPPCCSEQTRDTEEWRSHCFQSSLWTHRQHVQKQSQERGSDRM